MMFKKRGFILIVLFFLIFFSFNGIASITQYTQTLMGSDDSNGQCEDGCSGAKMSVDDCGGGFCTLGECDGGEYYEGAGISGCRINVFEYDLGLFDLNNDCAQAELEQGTIIEQKYKHYGSSIVQWVGKDDEPDAKRVLEQVSGRYNNNPNSLLCKQDTKDTLFYWYKCDSNTLQQKLSLSKSFDNKNVLTFMCLKTGDEDFVWKNINEIDISVDADEDGVPDVLDCAPDDKKIFPKFNCGPKLDKETGKKVVDETTGEEIEECSVKGAPRVCGDQIDNDCSISPSSPYNIEDNCDNDKDRCESNCLNKGGKCSWAGISNSNVNEGVCCGDDGQEDLGKIVKDKDGNSLVCLNSNDVGSKTGKFEDLWEEMNCLGEWCFVSASGSAKFEVFTIRQSNKVYDVVSNSEKWVSCTAEVSALDKPIFDGLEEVAYSKVANRFRCYSDGDKWSWAECTGKLKGSHNEIDGKKTIKARYEGDALVSLQLANANPEGIVYKESIDLNMNSPDYKNFYDNDRFDFTGYDYLEFMVKFVGNDKGEPFTKLILPASVQLQIYGIDVEDGKGIKKPAVYFDQSVLGYIVGGQPFSNEAWMHLKVPISDFKGVKNIRIKANEENIIGVRNVYLSKEGEQTQFCSGADSSDKNIWLTNLDVVDGQVTGKDLCTNLYGKYAWLGDAVEGNGKCCGNDIQEYYAGISDNNQGCWNSLPIKENNTVMDVEFDAGYNKKEINIEYTKHDINAVIKENKISKDAKIKYSCSFEECLYPLPGEAPYIITNLHPDLYELYFVGEDGKEYLISKKEQNFEMFGNVKVKKLAQQVIYAGDETDKAFYGCQAASYLVGDNKVKPENNLDYCGFKGKYFCAPSVEKGTEKDKFTLINSWDNSSLIEAGYEAVKGVKDVKDVQLKLRTLQVDEPFRTAPRNLSAVILPARNFAPNAEFRIIGASVPNWEVFNAEGTLKTGEATNKAVVDGKFILKNEEILRSQKIVVGKNVDMQFSVESTCQATLFLVDKDGKATQVSGSSFNTGDNNYVQMEFKDDCILSKPMLQRVDEFGAVKEYNYASEPDKIARAGMACCPTDSCWNGYACVEEMSPFSAQAEHISEGRDYRCIKGKWEYLPVKFDWNGEEWGFCSGKDQCLVLRDDFGGKANAKAEEFTSGKYPICIDDKKSILDHYCDQGNWTSRTKFMATKLLEVAETSDYVLYCSNYEDILWGLDNKEDYVQGKGDSKYEQEVNGLLDIGEKKPTKQVCFAEIQDPAGKKLVSEKENTCINNVCVLKYKEGDKYKVVFATTLNKPINSSDSFLWALDVPSDNFASVCKNNEQSKFIECDLKGLNVPGELWYNEELQGVIYSKQGIKLNSGIVDAISDWFKQLWGGEKLLSEEIPVLQQGKNLKDIYVLKIKDKRVQAIKEIEGLNKTLIAQYENFNTPICDYVKNYVPEDLKQELLEEASGKQLIACSKKGNIQNVQAKAGLDILWPHLTGKLRVEEK